MKYIFINFGILLVSVVVVYVVAVKQDIVVYNKDDLKSISCGIPFQFITSDQSWRDPPYPWTASCGGGEFGDQELIDWPAFSANLGIYYLLLSLLLMGLKIVKNKLKHMTTTITQS